MKMMIEFSGKQAHRTEYRYAGKNLHAGDEFDCPSERDAKLLQAIGVAVPTRAPQRGASVPPGYATRHMTAAAPAPAPRDPFDHDGDGKAGGSTKPADPDGDLSALRAEYQTVVGKKPFNGWDADTLRQKITAAKG